MSNRPEMLSLARRALEHFRNGTTDRADAPMRIPVAAYLDAERYAHEIDRIFRRLPLGVALSLELPGPGSYLAQRLMGTPLLLTRDQDGRARAFLNVCRHRGAILCENGRGSKSRFSCPYHAWTFANDGRLIGINAPESFGAVDKDALGLTPLACVERCGIIWVCLTPGIEFDIDAWLGDFAPRLASLKLEQWHLYEQRELQSPGWKATLDGYLEVYHHDTVHNTTVGRHTIGNLLVHDTFGPHQRLTFGRRNIAELQDLPENEWEPERHIRIIHSVFPNLSISGILGDHCLVSQVFPDPAAPCRTLTRQTLLAGREPRTEAEHAASASFSAMTLQAVRDEDYAIVATVQSALDSGANQEFIFGRNEPGLQHYHRMVQQYAAS